MQILTGNLKPFHKKNVVFSLKSATNLAKRQVLSDTSSLYGMLYVRDNPADYDT